MPDASMWNHMMPTTGSETPDQTGRAPVRTYRGTTASERQAGRRERLLDAALELLGTHGWSETTMRGVCREAHLNPRYFYESFADLDALLLAMFDRAAAALTEQILAAHVAAPDDGPARAHAAISAFVHHVSDDRRLARILFIEALGNPALARRRHDATDVMAERSARLARETYGIAEDPDHISDIAATLLVGGIAELIVAWLNGRLTITRDQLIEDITELFVVTGEGAIAIAQKRAIARAGAR